MALGRQQIYTVDVSLPSNFLETRHCIDWLICWCLTPISHPFNGGSRPHKLIHKTVNWWKRLWLFGIVIEALFVFTADCGPPPSVDRATVSVGNNLQGTTRTYTCLSQTVMEGTPTTTCGIDGRWSSTDLYCRRKFNSQLFNQKFSTWLLMYLRYVIYQFPDISALLVYPV